MGYRKEIKNQRRQSIKTLAGSAVLVAWHKPILNSVVLPAHAQTSGVMSTTITASSLDADNPFARYILIVDAADNVLANCGASGGTATASGLGAGTYRVFADSEGMQNHMVTISTESSSQSLTVPTDTGTCNFLVASVSLPSGEITAATGNQVTSPWTCFTNQDTGCS